MSTNPKWMHVIEIGARVCTGSLALLYWTFAWPKLRDSALFALPALVFAAAVWSEIAMIHIVGPTSFIRRHVASFTLGAQVRPTVDFVFCLPCLEPAQRLMR